MVGAVVSILTAGLSTVVLLPALSTAVPDAVWLVPSLVMTESLGQVSIPESASLQVQWIVTDVLYQPLPLGLVVGAPLMVGAVRSILTGALSTVVLFPALSTAVPERDWLAPSPLMTWSDGAGRDAGERVAAGPVDRH